jgi:hypothetical protein
MRHFQREVQLVLHCARGPLDATVYQIVLIRLELGIGSGPGVVRSLTIVESNFLIVARLGQQALPILRLVTSFLLILSRSIVRQWQCWKPPDCRWRSIGFVFSDAPGCYHPIKLMGRPSDILRP